MGSPRLGVEGKTGKWKFCFWGNITAMRTSNTCGFPSRRSLLYNSDFSNSHSISCNCLSRHWLLSKRTKSLVMSPEDIQTMKTEEKRPLAKVSRDLGMKWKQSNQQGMLDAVTSTVLTQGLASCYDAEKSGGPFKQSSDLLLGENPNSMKPLSFSWTNT